MNYVGLAFDIRSVDVRKIPEIVFVCNVRFQSYLFLTLRTLLASGSRFSRIVIYLVGETKSPWKFDDERIVVEPVEDISAGGYWYINKSHLCRSTADMVVFMDTDVFVRRPIDELLAPDVDLIARPAPRTCKPGWSREKWNRRLADVGCDPFPFYSSGFMIFRNGAHRRVGLKWAQVVRDILAGRLPMPVDRMVEMYAFAIAASQCGLTHESMPDHGHRYAMNGESPDDAIVHHLGTPGFYQHYLPLERQHGLDHRRDITVPRPSLLGLRAMKARAMHRIDTFLHGRRDKRMDVGLQ